LSEANLAGAPTINIGLFVNGLIDFVIVAFAIYLLLKGISRASGKPVAAPK